MNRTKLVVWVVVNIAAVLIIWRVGFYPPVPAQAAQPVESNMTPDNPADANESVAAASDAGEPDVSSDVNEQTTVSDANEPQRTARFGGRGGEPGQMGGRGSRLGGFGGRGNAESMSGRITDVNDGNEPMVALNLNNVEMRQVMRLLTEWTGKTIIPSEDAERIRVTIYAPGRILQSKALSHIYGALRMKGFVAEYTDDVIYLTPAARRLGFVPTVTADQPLAMIENKDQIVQKFFKLQSKSPSEMVQVIQPLMGEYGYVMADETTGTLLTIDTVQNLISVERIIRQFDVPEAEQSEQKIYVIQYGDPSEIVQMLNIMLGQSQGLSSSRGGFSRGGGGRGMMMDTQGAGTQPQIQTSTQAQTGARSLATRGSSGTAAATTVVIGSVRGPIVLIPEPRRKWVIARASADDMRKIDEWIKKLDTQEAVESEYEVVQLKYANPTEVESSIQQAFNNMPGIQLQPNFVVEPLVTSRQVLVFGRTDLREMIKKIIAEIDIPPGEFVTEHIKLKYADPDQIKTNIDELYQEGLYSTSTSASYSMFGGGRGSFGRSSTASTADTVRVISYISLKEVTVIASPENMVKIKEQIALWDRPIDINEVKPRIIELRNSDPIQLADLLNSLFSSSSSSTSRTTSTAMLIRGMSGTTQAQQMQSVIGPLYGQLTFADVPGTKKIIVISKIPEAYDVIEQMVLDLDREEMAEVPRVVQIKYANPEELSERLNALFNEMGTTAAIRRTPEGLSAYSMETGTTTTSTTTTEYRPPWNTGRSTTDQVPISNVIGRVRFVPDTHSKSILVLAPPQFMENIEKIINELDVPGRQVMIRAIVVEVDHTKVTSLGVELATNSSAFGTLEENSMMALGSLTTLGRYGSTKPIGSISGGGQEVSASLLGLDTDVYALVDFLIRKTNAKVLNQQTVWTKDNKEATFFKGEKVPFSTGSTVTGTGVAQQSYEFQRVGMTLRGRPSITPEQNVDMIVNVILSQLTEQERFGMPYRSEMETTTNMIVKNGQTIMLGGILSQKDSIIKRKMPLLGDLPLIGGLFGHEKTVTTNNELIVFITPYVVDELINMLPEAQQELENKKSILQGIKEHLKSKLGSMTMTEDADTAGEIE